MRRIATRYFFVLAWLATGAVAVGGPDAAANKRGATRQVAREVAFRHHYQGRRGARTPPHYAQIRQAAQAILLRFPPAESYYVGVGRSPAMVTAFLEATTASPMVVDFPVSGLGWQGAQVAEIDKYWPSYRQHMHAFLPRASIAAKRRLVLIDGSSGNSTENFRYAVRKYLAEEDLGSIEVVTVTIWTGAEVAPNPATEEFRFRQGVDFAAPDLSKVAGAQGYASFKRSHYIGVDSLASLATEGNPRRATYIARLIAALRGDKVWHDFLQTNFSAQVEAAPAAPVAPTTVQVNGSSQAQAVTLPTGIQIAVPAGSNVTITVK